MTPRRLPLRPGNSASHALPAWAPFQAAPAGWTRKALALSMHCSCLALFGLLVVWPVLSPIASGELAREFEPVLEALAALAPWERSPAAR